MKTYLLRNGDNDFETRMVVICELPFGDYTFAVRLDPPYPFDTVNNVLKWHDNLKAKLPVSTEIGVIAPRWQNPSEYLVDDLPKIVNLYFIPKDLSLEKMESLSQAVHYAACVVEQSNARS